MGRRKVKPTITLLPTESLEPNDYNPNEMTGGEFAELVAEVKHLRRLPKPIIVRPNGDKFTIVDGEHNWEAAKDLGWANVPCEVQDISDFESMRQTYKRNQHGTHNPVLLGQMFQRMKDEKGLSNRQLANEIEVSEGTIRNALLYAKAAEVRNDYAVEGLSVQQVRLLNRLPRRIAESWLGCDADLLALINAVQDKEDQVKDSDEFKRLMRGGRVDWDAVVDAYKKLDEGGYLDAYFESYRHAWYENITVGWSVEFLTIFSTIQRWCNYEQNLFGRWREDDTYQELMGEWREFVKAFLKRFKFNALNYLEIILGMIFDSKSLSFLISSDEFKRIIDGDEYKNTKDLSDLVRIAVYEKHEKYLEHHPHYDHPPTIEDKLQEIEIQDQAPDYIKNSPLVPHLQYALWKAKGPGWAKRELAKKSYIPINAQKEIDELVQMKEYEAHTCDTLAKQIAEQWPLYGDSVGESTGAIALLAKNLSKLTKDELFCLNKEFEWAARAKKAWG